MMWPHEYLFELEKLWDEGLSGSQIAVAFYEKFGVEFSRNAVIGKANRLKLEPRAERTNPNGNRAASRKPPVKVIPLALKANEVPIHQRKTLFDLRTSDCRWPYGDPGSNSFFFCGAERELGHSYCLAHIGLSTGNREVFSRGEFERRARANRKLAA